MRDRSSIRLFLAGSGIGLVLALRLLVPAGWDPSVFAAFGENAVETTEYAENALGRPVLTRDNQGHDGKFFFVQANDPWIVDPEENAVVLERPVYTSQRMLYPMLAGGLGFFAPEVILWALVLTNVLMLGAGSWAVAGIARQHGVTEWLGLAFALNVGLARELFIDGAGIAAFALAALGAWALEEERIPLAAFAFTGAALTREVMAIFIAFVVLIWFARRRAIVWRLWVPGALAVVGWAAYVRIRIDLPFGTDQVQELTVVPFSGLAEALTSGNGDALDLLAMGVFVVLMILVPYRAWKSDVYLTWGAVGFAFLGPFLTLQVWQESFDISRALAPLVTVFVVEMFMARRRKTLDNAT